MADAVRKDDQNTPIEDINVISNPVTRSLIDRYVLLSPFCQNKSVLSISCGWGYGEMILRGLGAKEVVGIDMDAKAINFINNTFSPQVTGVLGNFITETIDLKKTFDTIISIETFEHVKQDDLSCLLDTIKRHATPQSTLIITTPRRRQDEWDYKGGTHEYEYSIEEFKEIVDSAFIDTWNVNFMLLIETRFDNNYYTGIVGDINQYQDMAGLILVAVMTPKNENNKNSNNSTINT